MQVRNMDDIREALERMARHNRVSITGLNEMASVAAQVGQGILTRLMRKEVPSRPRHGETASTVAPDIKLSTFLRVINSAGWVMELRPVETENRRTRLRAAARNGQEVDTDAPAV